MAFKKSCGNTIKFATQNISPALIQVQAWMSLSSFTLWICNIIWESYIFAYSGCHPGGLRFWLHNFNGSKFQQRRCTHFWRCSCLYTSHARATGNNRKKKLIGLWRPLKSHTFMRATFLRRTTVLCLLCLALFWESCGWSLRGWRGRHKRETASAVTHRGTVFPSGTWFGKKKLKETTICLDTR